MFSKRSVIIVLCLSIAGALIAIGYGAYEKYRMSQLPTKIVYESDSLIANPILYIKNLKYKNAYLEYIDRENKRDTLIPINFPLIYMPGGERIYIRKYLEDSSLVEFFNPNSRNAFEGFITGYVHKKYIHMDTVQIEKTKIKN